MAIDYKVHQIMIKMANGYNLVTREEFANLPVNERTHLLMGGKVQFLNSNGDRIPLMEGVKDIQACKSV